uniref:orotate phosphoribosyltransferase n=1 Tax=viral metagenome TaxID=1070528 RepID=A0A6C0E9T7_9ZZZZ
MAHHHLLSFLYKNNFIKFGDFTLKSGKTSPLYFDFRSIISNYDVFNQVVDLLKIIIMQEYTTKNKVYLCGVPYGGISFASILNDKFHRETPGLYGLAIARQKRKNHGIGGYVFGLEKSEEKNKIILIEDVITTGMSIYETILELEKENCEIIGVVSIFDRNESIEGFQFPRDKYPIKSIFTYKSLLHIVESMSINTKINIVPYLKENIPDKRMYFDFLQLIQNKKSNLAVAVDNFQTPKDILNYLSVNASKIVILKLHTDIMVFSDHPNDNQLTEAGFWANLKHLKNKYNFLIMEDAKIADISKIALKKLKRINLYDTVDLVTIHGLNAESLLKSLPTDYNGPKLVIVSDMSSDNFMTNNTQILNEYREKCFSLSNNPNVFGYVTQNPPNDTMISNGAIYMTPGISINTDNTDNINNINIADQYYRTPENAINGGSHVIIVGSGITDFQGSIDEMTSKYQLRGFEAYKNIYQKID